MNGGLQQSARVAAAVDRELSRDAQLIALRIAAPKRADAGRIIAAQDDAAHLPLFVAANEPKLL